MQSACHVATRLHRPRDVLESAMLQECGDSSVLIVVALRYPTLWMVVLERFGMKVLLLGQCELFWIRYQRARQWHIRLCRADASSGTHHAIRRDQYVSSVD